MASRSLGTLTLDIIAQTSGFVAGMDKAARTADKRMKEIRKNAEVVGKAIGGALVAGATAAVYAIDKAIDKADNLSKAAQKIGVTTESLSALSYAAELADVSLEQLQGGLGKMVKLQASAAQGNKEAAETFAAFGIEIRDATGHLRATEDVFADFAEVFRNLPDGPEKTALAMRAFGKTGAELIPLLNEGAGGLKALGDEALRTGNVLSTEAGKNAEEFNDQLTSLKQEVEGLALQIAADLLPDLIDLVAEFKGFVTNGGDVAGTAHTIAESIRAIGNVVGIAVDGIQAMASSYIALGNSADALIKRGPIAQMWDFFSGTSEAADASRESLKGAAIAWDQAGREVEEALSRINGTHTGPGPKGPDFSNVRTGTQLEAEAKAAEAARKLLAVEEAKAGKGGGKAGGKSDAQREAEQLKNAYRSLIERQEEQIAMFGKVGEAAQVRYDTEQGALSGLSEAKKAQLIENAKALDMLEAEAKLKDDLNAKDEERLKAIEDQRKALKDLLTDMEFELELMGMSNVERQVAIELQRLGIDTTTAEGKAAEDSIRKRVDALDSARAQVEGMDELRGQVGGLFEDLTDGVGSATEAFDTFIANIRTRVLQLLSEKLIEKLFGSFGTTQSGMSGGWGAFLGQFLGGARAAGGPVTAGVPYLVGERGPEVIVPRSAGTVVPNSKVGGTNNVTQTFVIDTKGQPITKETQQQIAMAAGRAAGEAMARNR